MTGPPGRVVGGWLERAPHHFSPNQDARPAGCTPELLVIHNISLPPGKFGGPWIDRLFTNRLDFDSHPWFQQIAGLRVSAHALIRRNGSVVQYVGFDRRAWHAGASCFEGRKRCNDFSIGIELEGTDQIPYTGAQYLRLCQLTHAIMDHYPGITTARITGHSAIAPGRKTDPGPSFDWNRYRRAIGNRA